MQYNARGDSGDVYNPYDKDTYSAESSRAPVNSTSKCGACTTSQCKCIGEKGSRVSAFIFALFNVDFFNV